jgi:nucleotidyltransferase substrate binding protein (TIGR01987 family)
MKSLMIEQNLNSLEKAILSLEDILKQSVNPYIRDGVIQRFEYTFELVWKSLQRRLKDSGLTTGSPKDVFRAAFQSNLIENVEVWFEFLKSRNLTVHTYNEDVAEEVYQHAKRFPPFARKVLVALGKSDE